MMTSCIGWRKSRDRETTSATAQSATVFAAARRRHVAPSISDSTPDVGEEQEMNIAVPSRLSELPPEVLTSGAIICPGCRDAIGQPVLIFTCRATRDTAPTVWHRTNVVHLARLALYCCCNSCCCGGSGPTGTISRTSRTQGNGDKNGHVTLIIDTRTAGLNELDTLAEVLRLVEASQPEVFKSVYVVVDKITEAVLSQVSLFPAESSAKVELIDEEELCKFLEVDCLPNDLDLGGALSYKATLWIDYQQKLDTFVADCYDVATCLMATTDEITRFEGLPSSVYESKVTIDRHDLQVQTILEQPQVSQLLESGEDVLNQLSKMVDDLGSGIVFRDCIDAATKFYRQVCNGCQRLMNAASKRSITLQRCLQLRQFEDRASTIINWLCTEGEDGLIHHAALADNLRAIETQWIELDKFNSVAQVHIEASADVLDEAAMMTQLGVCDEVTGVREVCRELKSRVSTFITRLLKTRSTVESALKCYMALDQIYEWALDTMKLIDVIRRQRSLSRADIDRSLNDLDCCSSRRPQLPDSTFALQADSSSATATAAAPVSSASCQQSPPRWTSASSGGIDRLVERCRLAAIRSVETGNHLEMCRTALHDALHRLITADSTVASLSATRVPLTPDRSTVSPFQTPTVDEAPSFCRRRRQTASNSANTSSVNSSSHSLLSSSTSVLLPVADVGMLAANLCSVSSSPAFDVSDYMLDDVSKRDSTVFVDFSNDELDCDKEGRIERVVERVDVVTDVVDRDEDEGGEQVAGCSRRSSVTNLDISIHRSISSTNTTSTKDKTPPSNNRLQLDRAVSTRRNSSVFPSHVVIELSDVATINRSASSALLGSLSASILAIPSSVSSSTSMSFSTPPLRASSSSAMVMSSRTPPMSMSSSSAGGSDRGSKRFRQRWKILRKAISTIVDGNDSSQGRLFDDNQLERQRQLIREYELQQLNGSGMQDISVESLPGLYSDETLTCIANDAADRIPSNEDTMRSKYGWMATPSESNGTTQLMYANRHAVPSRASSLIDLHSAENEARRSRVLLYVMQELVQTERDYVRALGYVIQNYIPEILLESVPQQLRGKKSVIFENLEKIYDFHSQTFLTKIEKCASSPYRLGTCFLQHESELYMYALYNKNKPQSDELMMECGSKYFKAKQLELNDRMDLSSYLLKPVQRMGKYALLLAQITDECPTTHPDHVDLKAALEMIRFQLRHGNDLLAMDCIRSCDVNLQEQGMLLRQAEFVVLNGRKKCLRHIFLFEELVLFSKTRHSPTGNDIYIYKNSMKTSDIGLTESVGDAGDEFELWFRKRTSGSTFKLRACSVHVCSEWVRDISRLLWKQTMRNRERRLAEMACLGVGNKPSLDLKPSDHNINDRFVDVPTMHRGVRMRTSIPSSSISSRDHNLRNGNKRPHSLVSVSSSSSSGSGLSASGFLNGVLRHGYPIGMTLTPVSQSTAASMSVDGCVVFGTQPALGPLLGTLSTMHESPLEQITESPPSQVTESPAHCQITELPASSQVTEEETDDSDKSSLLREIDDHLNAIAKDNTPTTKSPRCSSSSSNSSAPYDTAASDSDSAEINEGVTIAAGDLVDDIPVFEPTDEDCGGISDEDAEEYRLFTSDLTIPDLYDQLCITKPCLADINML